MALDYANYEEAKEKFRWSERWALFDGNKEKFNIAHECIDRHPQDDVAIRIKFSEGKEEIYKFDEFSELTRRFANHLESLGIAAGDRVAILRCGGCAVLPALWFRSHCIQTGKIRGQGNRHHQGHGRQDRSWPC